MNHKDTDTFNEVTISFMQNRINHIESELLKLDSFEDWKIYHEYMNELSIYYFRINRIKLPKDYKKRKIHSLINKD